MKARIQWKHEHCGETASLSDPSYNLFCSTLNHIHRKHLVSVHNLWLLCSRLWHRVTDRNGTRARCALSYRWWAFWPSAPIAAARCRRSCIKMLRILQVSSTVRFARHHLLEIHDFVRPVSRSRASGWQGEWSRYRWARERSLVAQHFLWRGIFGHSLTTKNSRQPSIWLGSSENKTRKLIKMNKVMPVVLPPSFPDLSWEDTVNQWISCGVERC